MSSKSEQLAIDKIREILRKLYVKARAIDNQAQNTKQYQHMKHRLFDQHCFNSISKQFLPYVTEVEKELKHAEQLLAKGQLPFFTYQLQKVEQQCTALITALNAEQSLKAIDQYKKDHRNLGNFKQKVAQIFQPIQALYGQLSETHDFERRLLDMLQQKEQQLADAKSEHRESLTLEVLTIHQRLGRCRQAMTKLEKQIEQQEKR